MCGNDGLHSISGSLQCTGLCVANLPTHHCTACAFNKFLVCSACGKALVPHNYGALFVTFLACDVVRELAYKVRLQLSYVAETHLLHKSLTLLVVLPGICGCLVTANVYLLVWEYVNDLVKHVLCELQHQWAGNVEHVAVYATVYLYAVCTVGATAKFGVCGIHGARMTRELNFGHNLNVALGCVCNNLAALLLCIEIGTIRLVYIVSAIYRVGTPRVAACSSNSCEFGVFLYLETPTLVIGKVPMKTVQLVIRHYVNHTLDFLDLEVVAADVEHKSAVLKTRCIYNVHAG